MGLDTYAVFPKGHESYTENGNNVLPNDWFHHALVGGMFSGDGSSFRGKVYNDYVHFVTGESLYQEEIPVDRVKRMATKLEAPNAYRSFCNSRSSGHLISEDEAVMLAEWFRTVADNNSVVVGWW